MSEMRFSSFVSFTAVVLDRQFLGEQYQSILDELRDYIKELARVELKHGGVVVHYYSWTSINLKKGEALRFFIYLYGFLWKRMITVD